jgi:tRNA(Arg) A34 adenosine deaminase TadA
MESDDAALMRCALEEAAAALEEGHLPLYQLLSAACDTPCPGEVPIGCVITRHGVIVARGRNATNARCAAVGCAAAARHTQPNPTQPAPAV